MGRNRLKRVVINPRAEIWKAVRALRGGEFTHADVLDATRAVSGTAICAYFKCLVAAGIIEKTFDARQPGAASVYRLARDPGAETPRVRKDGTEVTEGRIYEAMWRTMKRLGAFTVAELALTASTDKTPVSDAAAKTYARTLKKAGLLRLLAADGPGNAPDRLLFVKARDLGPLPPRMRQRKHLWDPNSKKVIWPQVAP